MYEWSIIIILLLFFAWYVTIKNYPRLTNFYNDNKKILVTDDIDTLLSTCKNGDLLFFSGNTFGEKSIKLYSRSYVSHVCIIFLDKDIFSEKIIPYVWESDLGCNYKDGPRVMRLVDKLSRTKCERVCIWKKYLGPSIYTTAILNVIPKYVDMDIDIHMLYWLFSSCPNSFAYKMFKKDDMIFCSELVASTLIDLDILETKNIPSWFSPQKLLELDKKYGINRYVKF